LGRRRFILKGLEEKENKIYSLIFIGPRKRDPILEGKWEVFLEKKKNCVLKGVHGKLEVGREFGRGDQFLEKRKLVFMLEKAFL
jgi:hypothetical protein